MVLGNDLALLRKPDGSIELLSEYLAAKLAHAFQIKQTEMGNNLNAVCTDNKFYRFLTYNYSMFCAIATQ
ncbi:MAG TPA: hypothetical protein DCQ31_09895 [Bacteroidales bacterium]|nr:hypothetical protein [Bacteroidales bacterium]